MVNQIFKNERASAQVYNEMVQHTFTDISLANRGQIAWAWIIRAL